MALPPRADMSEPNNIFQDAFFNQSTPMISHAPMPSVSKPPHRRLMANPHNASNQQIGAPLGHSNTNGSIVINPPPLQPSMRYSPTKMKSSAAPAPPLSPLKASQRNKLNAVQFAPPSDNAKSTDSIQKKQPMMSRFQTVAQKPTTDANAASSFMGNKENNHPIIFPAPPGLNLSIENYYQKAPGKRLLEPAPIRDTRPVKRARVDEGPLPPHDSFPPIVDDGSKPGHSYAMLIGMAILRSAGRKLTLSQIYKWISDTYSFYNPQDAGWQNSIRHNLSLNKAFVKKERPKEDPGKGNYWAIDAGMEYLFMKDKAVRKPSGPGGDNLQVMSSVLEPSLPPMPSSFQEPVLPQLPPMPSSMVEPSSTAITAPAHSTRQPAELSSDATIIVSDSAAPDEQTAANDEKNKRPGSSTADGGHLSTLDSQFSPNPATALHSSPPITRHIDAHSGTPPPAPRAILASSAARSRKRKAASMDDSGYISSLESSALRSTQNVRHHPETGDRSRIKRGRAEEEIARLRASSYDSPTKNRSRSSYNPASSSPLRRGSLNDSASNRMPPPPLTPAVKLKAPMKPPPSVSPGTNLRMHRDRVHNMLASPLRRMASASDDTAAWDSPLGAGAFDESVYNFIDDPDFSLDTGNLGNAFEIFQDDAFPNLLPSVHNGSPVKSAPNKRPRLDRPHSASALSDVTNSAARRQFTSAPFLKVPNQSPGPALDTPSKFFDGLPSSPSKFFDMRSPSKQPRPAPGAENTPAVPSASGLGDENSWVPLEDFCTPDFFQEGDEFNGLDILQGFEKIGSNAQPQQLFSIPPQPRLMPFQQQQQQQQQSQQQPHGRQGRGQQKPALERSFASTF